MLKVREQRGGQKSSRRVYLCDKSLPFVRREVPRFQKALTCRVSRALSCAPSRIRDSRESTVDDYGLLSRKSEQNPAEEATEVALVSDKVKYRSDVGSSFVKEKERERKSSAVLSSPLITT